MNFFFDYRWTGNHGIGRVSKMLDDRLNFKHLPIKGKPSSPLDPLKLFAAMLLLPNDAIIFSPGYNAPLFTVRPYIFIIHDLNHIDRNENASFLKKRYYQLIMRRACRAAFKVLTVSEFSRQRIISWAQLPAEHVVNIGNGVDECFNQDVNPFVLGYQYFFCVSNRKPHKNEELLLEAFSRAHIDPAIRLLFTGVANDSLMSKCKALGIDNRVVFYGRVPDEILPGLYRGAIALLFPSLYEGFGLPVIEAMACGTPVMTSNATSLPEVAGDAALLVDPLDITGISKAIETIVSDGTLRSELVARGLERAKQFSWDSVLSKVKSVLDDVENKV